MTDPITEILERNGRIDVLSARAEEAARLTVNPHIAPCTCTALELIARGWPAKNVKHARSCPRD